MDEDDPRRLVISTRNGNSYHKPVDVDASNPEPDCQLAKTVEGEHWAWRDRETAYNWKDPCSYCYGEYPTPDDCSGDGKEADTWPC
jgi:hypothetical protein